MKRQLAYGVIADGGTDRALIPIINWAIHQIDPQVEILEPDFAKRRGKLSDYVNAYESGAMLLFVHRDTEKESLHRRLEEFDQVRRADVVPIVPVRMTEAWLLFDGDAIAQAADAPGAAVLIPSVNKLEDISDPKQKLEDLLLEAAGMPTGRRRKNFQRQIATRRVNVASLIKDFTPLEALPAFAQFQASLRDRYPYGV